MVPRGLRVWMTLKWFFFFNIWRISHLNPSLNPDFLPKSQLQHKPQGLVQFLLFKIWFFLKSVAFQNSWMFPSSSRGCGGREKTQNLAVPMCRKTGKARPETIGINNSKFNHWEIKWNPEKNSSPWQREIRFGVKKKWVINSLFLPTLGKKPIFREILDLGIKLPNLGTITTQLEHFGGFIS